MSIEKATFGAGCFWGVEAAFAAIPGVTATAVGYEGKGDFFINGNDTLRRRGEAEAAPLLFSGVQILHPRLFEASPSGKFSLNVLYDRALAEGRLFGLVHDGGWFHVGTPEALPEVEGLLLEK